MLTEGKQLSNIKIRTKESSERPIKPPPCGIPKKVLEKILENGFRELRGYSK